MERASPRPKMKTTPFCIPRLRGTNTIKTSRMSPMTLLQRFREAVFRLMMFSALSSSSNNGTRTRSPNNNVRGSYYHRTPADPHHSEAVADCIEFIKKTTLTEANRDSTASSSMDSTTDMVPPVPVM